jgi:pimeloyl-ACP methyl ester carboxylesterase
MTDQIGPGAAAGPATLGTAALGDGAPIRPWPGKLVSLSLGEVFVRTAPAMHGAEPAVFVHGLGGSAVNWTDLMDQLSRPGPLGPDSPVLAGEAVDLPGFGYSPAPPDGDYSFAARVAVVTELIEKRGNWPVHLIGNSMGGAIATRVAARRPDLVRTLTLISPALPDLRPRPLPMRLALVSTPGVGRVLMNRLLRLPAAQRADLTITDLYADPGGMEPQRRAEAVAEVVRRDGLGYATDALLASGRAMVAEYFRWGPTTLWRDAARVTAPVLVIHGSHDRLVDPANAGRAARTFRSAKVVVLPRTGHVAMMERPGQVAAEMRDFIETADATAPGGRRRAERVG